MFKIGDKVEIIRGRFKGKVGIIFYENIWGGYMIEIGPYDYLCWSSNEDLKFYSFKDTCTKVLNQ